MSTSTERPPARELPSIGRARTRELTERLAAVLGAERLSVDPSRIERLSVDWAHMSPILSAQLPAGRADLIATPSRAEQIPEILRVAYQLEVPVTARGTGLGNYGQAIPLHGGLLLDVSACRAVEEVGWQADQAWVRAEAGVRMRDLDNAVAGHGQELRIYPSTKGSTLGGFLAGGSGGTGSITYGSNADGLVTALDVAPCDGSGELIHAEGEETVPYIHAYGITGVLARATVLLAPRRDWVAVWAAAPDYPTGTDAMRALLELDPEPRLVSLDEPTIVAELPRDPALDPARVSVRAIVAAQVADAASALLRRAGAEVLSVRTGLVAADRITSLSYNHSTFHLQKRHPEYFHLEVAGTPLWDDPDAVRAIYPGTTLHLELMRERPIGMLMAPYVSPEQVYAGMDELEEIGMSYHSPHNWMLDRRLDEVRATVGRTDPRGLLNPGKLTSDGKDARWRPAS
ncbi:FAD-binding oxidoreductase [Pseudonocardia sp. Cha107L01]|uniref:FAD-binding oxidoreductase n=1 Tax=Pseudonocardia sp. Cha107L01 TaxID=3457576 RepID=UPI00403E7390